MDKEILRKVQLAELEILNEVVRVCNENEIRYFLSGGTLLGAIRHGGFIPWDDDIDIAMLREEFDKFVSVAPVKLSEQYFLQTWDNDEKYPYASVKVRKKGTVFREASSGNEDCHSELFIDIFPYDTYPETKEGQRKQGKIIDKCRKSLMMKAGMTPWRMKKKAIKKIGVFVKNLPYIFISRFKNRKEIKDKLNKTMRMFNGQKTGYVFEECNGTDYGKFVFPLICIGNYSKVLFEGIEFSAPENPDLYLSSVYGDYMKLPPEDKRVNHAVVDVKL